MLKILIALFCCITVTSHAQYDRVHFNKNKKESKVDVYINGKVFTSLLYPDSLEKPVLYPILSAGQDTITRGFPLTPRDGERVDHPHHVGMWFNYESVNGLDFWNNSYNIPAARKSHYGWIRNVQVTSLRDGKDSGLLQYSAQWQNQAQKVLLQETTDLVFRGTANTRVIERTTTLTAAQDTVFFKDIKDGLLAIRVAKELEMPSAKADQLTDAQGNRYKSAVSGATGNYTSSAGKKGDAVWATRASWCMLSATLHNKPVTILIADHPSNPGYPAYWHARGYGLFAVNPLGQQVFSNGREQLNLTLAPGQSVTFRYKVVIQSGTQLTAEMAASHAGW